MQKIPLMTLEWCRRMARLWLSRGHVSWWQMCQWLLCETHQNRTSEQEEKSGSGPPAPAVQESPHCRPWEEGLDEELIWLFLAVVQPRSRWWRTGLPFTMRTQGRVVEMCLLGPEGLSHRTEAGGMQVGQEKSFPLTLLGGGLGVKLSKDVNKEGRSQWRIWLLEMARRLRFTYHLRLNKEKGVGLLSAEGSPGKGKKWVPWWATLCRREFLGGWICLQG